MLLSSESHNPFVGRNEQSLILLSFLSKCVVIYTLF